MTIDGRAQASAVAGPASGTAPVGAGARKRAQRDTRLRARVRAPSWRPDSAEFVLPGHPDRLCDAVADAIVDEVRHASPAGQCGIEVACVFDHVVLTGRVASSNGPLLGRLRGGRVEALVRETYASAGYGVDAAGRPWGPLPESLHVTNLLAIGAFQPGEEELRHLSDDQAICVGYALRSPATGWLPPAHWLARRVGAELFRLRRERGAGQVGPDGKVLVRGRRGPGGAFVPELVSISLNHHERSDWLLLRSIAEEAVETACRGLPMPELTLNGAGMFVCGGPNGDNGLSGKKLVIDACGPGVPIGGGAWAGKDFFKVDRLGGMLARRLALASLTASAATEARVTLTYLPGGDRPARADLLLDGEVSQALVAPEEFGALETRRVWARLVGEPRDLVEAARWGMLSHPAGVSRSRADPAPGVRS